MNTIDKTFSNTKGIKEFSVGYFSYIANLLSKMDLDAIDNMLQLFLQTREQSKCIYFIGNGGSAATATHFANDIGIGTRSWEKPFKAISLTDNQAVITAIGNDYGYEDIFSKQLQLVLQPGDVLMSISASGNSPNLIKAVEYAKSVGAITISLTSFDGGKLKAISDHCVHVPAEKGEYGPAEDIHMIIDHLLNSYLSRFCNAKN